ncbi:hypothetical protein K439DRAFT_1338061 [Ramaria rubella]|nr:hypothetical protein K439DRAFT_1338061 [Ramaria rubella]
MTFVNVLLVGAGEINFGSVEGPWNHVSARLIQFLGTRLKVVAIIDPDAERAKASIASKLEGFVAPAYKHTEIFATVHAAAEALPDSHCPHLVILGAPPQFRGSDEQGRDLDLQLVRAFPKCALFVEKPVSGGPSDSCWRVVQELSERKVLVGVGYVLRYLKGDNGVSQIIEDNNLVVMGTNARYVMAYEYARKLPWWDKTHSCGPIVEQATHFCDLSRYFGGEVLLPSVTAHTVEHDETPGQLSAKRFDESVISPENRIPRLTSASWKYKGGAVGSLMHVIALHGTTYDTELEVYADGYRLKLVDPYNSPVLYVRRPSIEHEEVYRFEEDDPFYSELSTFIDAMENPITENEILSSYEDAVLTYEFTWKIRLASDASANFNRELQCGTSSVQ